MAQSLQSLFPLGETFLFHAASKVLVRDGTTGSRNITIASKTTESNGFLQCVINEDGVQIKDQETHSMMVIPNTVFEENGITFSTVSLYSFAFKDGTFFHNTHSTKTASGILSATLSNIKLENLKTPIDISFKRKGKEGAEKQTVVCGFWQKNTGKVFFY